MRTLFLIGLIGIVLLMGAMGCERWPWEAQEPSSLKEPASGGTAGAPPSTALPVPPHERAADVNGSPISTDDLQLAVQELKRFTEAYQQEWKPLPTTNDPQALDLHDVLDNLIDSELKAQDAKAGHHLDVKTEVRRRLAYLERSFYAQEWDRLKREQAVPTDEEIRKFYEDYKQVYVEPERIRVRQIVTNTLAEAEAARARAVKGEVFAQVARELSVGAGKENGGDIGWHLRALDRDRLALTGQTPTEGTFFPQLEPLAFALETGQISQPVKGPDGRYYIVQLEERKAQRQQTELEVRDAIKEGMTLQTMQEQLAKLREKAKIESFQERLADVEQ